MIGDLFIGFFDWMEALPPAWAYVALFAIAFGENVLPPIPGDLAIAFCGYLAAVGTLSFWPVVGLATVAGGLGFMAMYEIGDRLGQVVNNPKRMKWLPKEQIGKAQRWLRRWGYAVVAANRYLSGARSVISLTCGMAHMHRGKTAFWSTVSAFVWTAMIVYGGYTVGENWSVIGDYLAQYGRIIIALMVGVGTVALIRWWRKRGQEPSGRAAGAQESANAFTDD
ncbi:MAG: DedA family protein [Bacteroidota bacterium]